MRGVYPLRKRVLASRRSLTMRSPWPLRLCILALGGTPPAHAAGSAPAAGVVVEEVERGGVAERAGIAADDHLLSWSRGPAHPSGAGRGELRSPFDALLVEAEEAPRGPVILQVTRKGRRLSITLAAGEWGLRLRPALADEPQSAYAAGLSALAGGRADAALAASNGLAKTLQAAGSTREACWVWL